jgi:NAD-dependent dihydropyrimidine dehydrogenase PreA subunit
VIHQFETIIVGSGGSGVYAALEASQRSQTAVLSKLFPVRSHTGAAKGGISAALGNVEEDTPEWHAFDTVKGGDYLVDQQAAKILAEEAVQAVYDLENRGLPFNRTPEGRIDQRRFGGHTRNFGEAPVRRACYAADRTGHMILQTLQSQEERMVFDDTTNCILCASCYSACPIPENHSAFLGPAAIAQAYRFLADTRNQGFEERMPSLEDPDGIWPCQNHFKCTQSCPRSILLTKRINQTKKMIETYRQDRNEKINSGES